MRCYQCEVELDELNEEDVFSCQECGEMVCWGCISLDMLNCIECNDDRSDV